VADIEQLHDFLIKHEHYSVPLSSRLADKNCGIDKLLLNRNTVFIEEKSNNIFSALMISPEGIVCPILTSESSLKPLRSVINESAYAKKRYLTLMGLREDITALELLFKNRNRLSVDYDLLSSPSLDISSKVDNYLDSKDDGTLNRFRTRQALPSDLEYLMPLRSAYEIEEVILNQSNFNKTACRTRFSKTISKESVFFAEVDEKPVATCCISASGFKWGQIGGVYTLPEYRSNGLSALLMKATSKHAAKHGMDLMLFVKKDNKAALKLYSNCGFIQNGDYRISYLESR